MATEPFKPLPDLPAAVPLADTAKEQAARIREREVLDFNKKLQQGNDAGELGKKWEESFK